MSKLPAGGMMEFSAGKRWLLASCFYYSFGVGEIRSIS